MSRHLASQTIFHEFLYVSHSLHYENGPGIGELIKINIDLLLSSGHLRSYAWVLIQLPITTGINMYQCVQPSKCVAAIRDPHPCILTLKKKMKRVQKCMLKRISVSSNSRVSLHKNIHWEILQKWHIRINGNYL